jgi:ribosomal protein L24
MKIFLTAFTLFFLFNTEVLAQTEFELTPSQSMLMTGKGPGQDGTINPYYGEECFAIVENIGEIAFSIRVQQDGRIIKEIPIEQKEVIQVKLLKGYELYLDPNPKGLAKARVDYKKVSE